MLNRGGEGVGGFNIRGRGLLRNDRMDPLIPSHSLLIKHQGDNACARQVCSPLKQTEYGFGYITIRSPYIPYSMYLRETINQQQERGQEYW